MLSNPLCLAIQVLAILLGESPAVCTVFPGLARDDDVASSGWPGEAWLSSPVDDRCCIEETTPLLILASTWNQRRVTSVPVIASEPLNPRAVSYHGSGLVSSRGGNMLSNPLCLAIQVNSDGAVRRANSSAVFSFINRGPVFLIVPSPYSEDDINTFDFSADGESSSNRLGTLSVVHWTSNSFQRDQAFAGGSAESECSFVHGGSRK
ncbi:hypothetical protein HPB51_006075 [Rhipicephalus microplus]|uniref:Secreted protein n=1 Tax=Rhipicephalus microplus TaxID=6941 RepID=A0A9J6ERM5_RHIMP|nr:hypothetical protein HPB51_006075 [Rhipicephalus microplus]